MTQKVRKVKLVIYIVTLVWFSKRDIKISNYCHIYTQYRYYIVIVASSQFTFATLIILTVFYVCAFSMM